MPIPHTLAAHYRNMPITRVLLYTFMVSIPSNPLDDPIIGPASFLVLRLLIVKQQLWEHLGREGCQVRKMVGEGGI